MLKETSNISWIPPNKIRKNLKLKLNTLMNGFVSVKNATEISTTTFMDHILKIRKCFKALGNADLSE